MPQRGEFRATTDQMLDLIADLAAAENRKRSVPTGSDEFLDAAKDAADISRIAFRWAQFQLQMALTVKARIEAGDLAADVVLKDVQPRPLDRVLAQWREAQMRLELSEPGSPEAERATSDIERLREEYQAGREART
jgi:hypothetical protein